MREADTISAIVLFPGVFFLPSIFLTFGRIFQNIISKLSISLFPFLDA